MESGRIYNKILTSTNGTNLTNSATQSYKMVDIPTQVVATNANLEYNGEDDSQKVMAGAGSIASAGGAEGAPLRWGHVMPSGSRLEVNDSGGEERIDIVHHTGAGITVEPDGSAFIVGQSSRGLGISAPFGDVFITSAGDFIIDGSASISIRTTGDLSIDVGGTFSVKCNDYKLITKSSNVIVDGSASTNVTYDNSVVIGGLNRLTVAGDMREQVSKNRIQDVGTDSTVRIGGKSSVNIIKDSTVAVKGNLSTSVSGDNSSATTGKQSISSEGEMQVHSAAALKQKGDGIHILSGADAFIEASGTSNIKAGGAVKLTGSAINASPAVDLALWSNEAVQAGQASSLGGSLGSKPSEQTAGSAQAAEAGTVAEASDAQVMESKDIIDTLTSARKFPDYPENGVLQSANATGMGTISYDQTPGAQGVFDEYSGGNSGNMNPASEMGTYDTLPADPVNRDADITAIDPNIQAPSQHELSAKISKHFTLGQLLRSKDSNAIPSEIYEAVVKNIIILANNVLDPIKEQFPDMQVNSVYRPGRNHKTGRAVDIVVASRSITRHAEIARFARDKLPVDQVFIEKNNTRKTHVHLRVSATGSKGNPLVLSCGDQQCLSTTPGIDVAWLGRKGAKSGW